MNLHRSLLVAVAVSPSSACTPAASGFGSGFGDGTHDSADPGNDDGYADETGAKLDVGSGGATGGADDGGSSCPEGGTPEYEFSVIWIANSGQGTVSKIDTITATELARYHSGPPVDGEDRYLELSPSRTSVNLRGDVVVGNRGTHAPQSSFTKITGAAQDCPDRNGDGVIRTSEGPDDILPWGQDDCVEWNYPVPSNMARAVAWDAGSGECGEVHEPHVWLGYRSWDEVVHVDLVDGDAGTLIERVVIDDPAFTASLYGIYGGAADKDGNFWGVNSEFVFIDRETFEWRIAQGAGYGFALDPDGNPWGNWGGGRVAMTDAATGALVDIYEGAAGGYDRGIAIDAEHHLWMVTNGPCGIARFDLPSLTWIDPHITWPGCQEPVGVSIDFEGHVWVVDREAERALKLLPNPPGEGASVVAEVTGLVSPYTYSDMTGAALNLVVNPPPPVG